MLYTKEYLTESSIFSNAVTEIRKEERKQGIEQGIEQAEKREREKTIMNMRREMGLTAKQIAKVKRLHVQYVQSVIDKFEKKA